MRASKLLGVRVEKTVAMKAWWGSELEIDVMLPAIRSFFEDCPEARFVAPGPKIQVKVTWQWWRISHSEYHYREPGELDLGEICKALP
jgi:hypothetical protein